MADEGTWVEELLDKHYPLWRNNLADFPTFVEATAYVSELTERALKKEKEDADND